MPVGSLFLGIKNSNKIAYADDICLLISSESALQYVINKFNNLVNVSNLKINIEKFYCIKFAKFGKPFIVRKSIKLKTSFLEFWSEIKYLAFSIKYNLCDLKWYNAKIKSSLQTVQ